MYGRSGECVCRYLNIVSLSNLRLTTQVLADLHSRDGRSFRDLKPENMLVAGKKLVLIDWCFFPAASMFSGFKSMKDRPSLLCRSARTCVVCRKFEKETRFKYQQTHSPLLPNMIQGERYRKKRCNSRELRLPKTTCLCHAHRRSLKQRFVVALRMYILEGSVALHQCRCELAMLEVIASLHTDSTLP